MTDNVTLNAGSGGSVIAADDIGGVKYPRTKITLGLDGVNDSDVAMSNPMPVQLELVNSFSGDAFNRVRVSEPRAVFEVTHQYNLAPRLLGLQRNDAGCSIVHSSPVAVLSVPGTSGRRICHQSHRYCIYQPGKSQLVRITGQLGDGTLLAGMGYGDDLDGIFLERTTTGLQIRFSSSTVADQLILQSSWNLDKLNGTGASGLTVVAGNAQQLVIDLQWLGVGRVRVGLMIDGTTRFIHQFQFANIATTALMRTATLPVRWYAESLGTIGSMKAICASVVSEGGHDPDGQQISYARTAPIALLGSGIRTPLISIRPKLLFNSIENRGHIIPIDARALVATADNVLIELVENGTLTGDTFAVSPASDSHADIDIAATAITGGQSIWSDYISAQLRGNIDGNPTINSKNLPLVLRADGTSLDTLTLCATRISGAANLFAGLNWLEIR